MLAMTKHVHARLFLAAIFAASMISAPAVTRAAAQDAVPGTPSELKDFKLDPEKAPPVRQPLPTTETVVKPPAPDAPVVRAPAVRAPVIEVPAVIERAPAARTPAGKTPAVKAPAVKAEVKAEVKPLDRATMQLPPPNPALTAGEVNGDAAAQDADAELPATATEAGTTAPDTTAPDTTMAGTAPASSFPWGYILAGLLVAIGAGAAWFFKRRRRDRVDGHEAIFDRVEDTADGHSIAVPDPITQLAEVTAPLTPTPVISLPVIPAAVVPAKISANRPKLDISFVPEKASISLANLTIKGRLHIINNGADDAAAMQLNAAVISASQGQSEAISRYFSSTLPPGKELGAAKVGEQIALEMDLMIPIADLQTFVMGKQKLLVPIILARVEYQWGEDAQHGALHRDEAQLSCLIGREASPPKPKMGALRLDLGPRSFASLGQRPLPG